MKRKKIALSFIIAVLVVLIGFTGFILLKVPSIGAISEDNIVLGAHRGNSIDFIENTLPALESAVREDKYKFIEFDIMYTKDKKIVVHHDDNLLRLQRKFYSIGDNTYEDIINESDYHIPLYSEAMGAVAGEKPLNIEIKSRGNFTEDKEMVDFILSDLEERELLESTLISSISSDVIFYIKEKNPKVKTGKIYYISSSTFFQLEGLTAELYEEIERTNTDYVMLHGSNIYNYNSLKSLLPEDKTLVIWYFTDEMYVIHPTKESWLYKLRTEIKKIGDSTREGVAGEEILFDSFKLRAEGVCAWWCKDYIDF